MTVISKTIQTTATKVLQIPNTNAFFDFTNAKGLKNSIDNMYLGMLESQFYDEMAPEQRVSIYLVKQNLIALIDAATEQGLTKL